MIDTADIFRIYDSLKSDRSNWDSHWEEVAEVVLPRQRGFEGERTKGEKKTEKIFDSQPVIMLERFASVMDSMLTPRQSLWHDLRSTNPELNKDEEVKNWFYEANRRLHAARYSPQAFFAGNNFERWISMGAFGTGAMFIDFAPGSGLRYKTLPLEGVYLMENHQGVIDTVYRCFKFTARQAAQKWGKEKLPEKIQKALEDPAKSNKEFDFLHVVMPREDYDPERVDAKGKPWASLYLSVEEKMLLSEEGYNSWPFSISRYVMAPGETYGRGPAMMALADIKMLNQMSKSDIKAVHKLLNPAILTNDDGVLGGGMKVDLRPDAVNYGGLDSNGRQLIQPFNSGSRVDISEQKMEQRRQSIGDAFLVTLFQILVENPRMTATEALIRAQEKGMLMTPTMGRQQSEAIGPQIERELDLMNQNGMLPPMPPALVEAEGEYEIVYDSPMSRMQRAEELVGVQRTMEILAPFAQLDQTILDVFNPDELGRGTAEVSGVPRPMLRSPKEVAAIRKQRQEQEQAQMAMAAAQPVAGALKDAAQAQAIARGQ